MQKKSALMRTFACVLMLSFLSTLISIPALAEIRSLSDEQVQISGAAGGKVDLSYMPELAPKYAEEHQEGIVIAAQDKTDQPVVSSAKKSADQNCCGGFWEIHFGGYRWVWWALAGAGLIAIHAN